MIEAYAKLDKEKEAKLMGWVSRMMKDGKTSEEMSIAINQPVSRIEAWIDILKNAENE